MTSPSKHFIAIEVSAVEARWRHTGADGFGMGTVMDFLRHVEIMACARDRLKIVMNIEARS